MCEPLWSSVPRHHQIAQVLRSRLEAGVWGAGGAPATEQRLCEEFGASRTTIRQALSQLKQAGLLESRAGVGTRGVELPRKRKVVRASGDPLHAALNTRPRVMTLGEVSCPPAIAAFFGIAPGAPIWHFVRLHTLDGRPLSVVDSYLPAHLGASITRKALQQPMHEILWQAFGLRLRRSVHTLRVGRADVDVASLLDVALADPVLRIQSSVYLARNRPIRWTENYFREDQYEYVAEMEWPAPGTGERIATQAGERIGKQAREPIGKRVSKRIGARPARGAHA
jgi:GntR family transcriptional regulator